MATVVLAGAALGQRAPEIGYAFPAGGQVGSRFEVTVGGQFLDGLTNAWISGAGVAVSLERWLKPMNQGVFARLRDQLRALEQRKAAANRDRVRGVSGSTNEWSAADEQALDEVRERILRNPPNRNATPALAEVATLRVEIAADAVPGPRELRVMASGGLSNPLVFQVGRLREVTATPAQAPNPELDRLRLRLGQNSPAPTNGPATRVALPVTVNGQIMPGEVDRIRFAARQGQRLVAIGRARGLIPYLADAVPGWFQATLTLRDGQGRELAFADDYQLQPDPVLFCEIPADGEYEIEIRDALYRGREDFVYRLSLGELPFVTGAFALGGVAGQSTTVSVRGWNLSATTRPCRFDDAGVHVLAAGPGEDVLDPVPWAVDTLPEVVEAEPNDAADRAQSVTPPVIVNGRIDRPGDIDVFEFSGRAGDEVVVEVLARRLKSPLDSTLALLDPAGRQIAFNDDHDDPGSGLNTHHADSCLHVKLASLGVYQIRLADAQGKGGAEWTYRLRVSAPRSDFELRVVPSALNVRAGTWAPVTVHALRRDGFAGDIHLTLVNPPAGVSLSGGWVPAGQDRVRLTVTAGPDRVNRPLGLRIEGRAQIEGTLVRRVAVPADDRMQAFFYRHLVPAQEGWLVVLPARRAMAPVRYAGTGPVRIPVGGATAIPLEVPFLRWANQFQLALDDPPDGITLRAISGARDGVRILVEAQPDTVEPGLKGNLILTASPARPAAAGARSPGAAAPRAPAGAILPAIPFEVVRDE